jgi:hypothetical protein
MESRVASLWFSSSFFSKQGGGFINGKIRGFTKFAVFNPGDFSYTIREFKLRKQYAYL